MESVDTCLLHPSLSLLFPRVNRASLSLSPGQLSWSCAPCHLSLSCQGYSSFHLLGHAERHAHAHDGHEGQSDEHAASSHPALLPSQEQYVHTVCPYHLSHPGNGLRKSCQMSDGKERCCGDVDGLRQVFAPDLPSVHVAHPRTSIHRSQFLLWRGNADGRRKRWYGWESGRGNGRSVCHATDIEGGQMPE